MGMRPGDFEQMSPPEFFYAWIGWQNRELSRERAAWERTRWEIWTLTCIQLEPKDRRPMMDMFPLPWESPAAGSNNQTLSLEERQQRVQEILSQCKGQ